MLLTRTLQTSRECSAWAFPSTWTTHYQNLFIYLNTLGVSRSFLCPVNPRLPDDLWKYQYLWDTMALQNVCNFASLFVSTEDRKLSVAIAGEQQWGGANPWISSGNGWRAGGVVALFICEGTVKKITAGRKEEGLEMICRADVPSLVLFTHLIGYWNCCRIQGMFHRVPEQYSEGEGVCEQCLCHSKGL